VSVGAETGRRLRRRPRPRLRLAPGGLSAFDRRRTELGLILLVITVTVGLYVLVGLGRTERVPGDLQPFVGIVCALILGAHLANWVFARHAEPVLLPLATLLNGIGYAFIVRLSPTLADKQGLWTAVGIGSYAATLAIVRSTRQLDRYRYLALFLGMGLLALPLTPIGQTINGSRIWVGVGPVNFQPGEVAKLCLVIFFASFLVERREVLARSPKKTIRPTLPPLRHLGPLLGAWGVALAIMVFQRDLGSSLLFFTLFVTLLWVATARTAYLLGGLVMFAAGSYGSWRLFDHVQTRVSIWIDPWADADNRGYQIVQSMYAFGSGGITGSGLGLGSPTKIPTAYSDFIFAAIAEETGLLGATAVLLCFVLMIGSGMRTALRAERSFDKLLAVGITTIIGVQTFIIMGGVTRLVPLTGVTLPFVSYGGSSLVVNYVLIALLTRLSHETAVLRASTEQQRLAKGGRANGGRANGGRANGGGANGGRANGGGS
jgi:cell division protein FtsW (lipid II flippase)